MARALSRCCSSISSLLVFKHSVTLCAYASTTRGEGTGGKEEKRGMIPDNSNYCYLIRLCVVGRKKKSPFARTKIPGWSPFKVH